MHENLKGSETPQEEKRRLETEIQELLNTKKIATGSSDTEYADEVQKEIEKREKRIRELDKALDRAA